ncbi:MAG: 2,3-bisphosphoglycerate-independent phosphoglycerate mutase [Gammaproteobacteria bacterium]|nr:2,3-bisphosphoglycerate-independent phosphoglycerate mutase [Gammaproteobacteria bacterium]
MSPALLVILDGWGHAEPADDNAIHVASTPHWDALWGGSARTLISGSGRDVGLPHGQMGNSEVGHMSLGAGRVVHQDLSRIDLAIEDGSFASNPVLNGAIEKARGGRLHVLGLVSPGGVHSHEDQIAALIAMADRPDVTVCLHAFLDGRDTPPRSAAPSLERFGDRVASICGRYYAMDRDGRWDRVQAAFDMLTRGRGTYGVHDAGTALAAAYERGESDEFVRPTMVRNFPLGARVRDGDVVVFMNFRADRARQLTRAFVEDGFDAFTPVRRPKLKDFVTLTRYADDIPAACAFEPEIVRNSFGEHLSGLGMRQLRIAETEKYAHVTFFFSGGREQPFPGEDRVLVPSPQVATYDRQPQMSAPEVTDRLVAAIESGDYDAIVCNYANADMVGHTGDFDAAVQAVEAVDGCLGRIVAAVEATGGHCLITADHGNAERMRDAGTGQAHTAHTSELVPLVYVGPEDVALDAGGTLSDVAPTLLELMGLAQPAEMRGRSLVVPEPLRREA